MWCAVLQGCVSKTEVFDTPVSSRRQLRTGAPRRSLTCHIAVQHGPAHIAVQHGPALASGASAGRPLRPLVSYRISQCPRTPTPLWSSSPAPPAALAAPPPTPSPGVAPP